MVVHDLPKVRARVRFPYLAHKNNLLSNRMEYFRTGEVLGKSWELFKAHWLFLLMILGIMLLSQVIFSGLEKATEDMVGLSLIVSIATFLASLWISFNFIKLYLHLIDTNTEGKINEAFSFSQSFWPFLGASVLFGVMIVFGMLLFIVPGIYWALKYQFYGELIVDKKMGALESLQKSGEITKGVKWQLLGFSLVLVGMSILGVLALGVGLFVTIPMSSLAYIMVYRKLSVRLESVPPTPSVAQTSEASVTPAAV